MTDTRARLINWGVVYGGSTRPAGFPKQQPMFRDADKSEWDEPGWAELDINGRKIENVPSERNAEPDERDAELLNKLISTLQTRHQYALITQYAQTNKVWLWRRHSYIDSCQQAYDKIDQYLTAPQDNKKATVVNLLIEKKKHMTAIAATVGVTRQFVWQIARALNIHPPRKSSSKNV